MSNLSRRRTLVKRDRARRSRYRIRKKISGTPERPRLAVYKSLKFIYAQVIDDLSGQTLAQASSRESAISSDADGSAGSVSAAKAVGKAVAERAKEKGIDTVVFDRGGSIYHGKIRAIAEGAREAGLEF
ncbi:MAG: 50S ribosomal protein L18 [Acidobacteriota bacterium]